MTTEIQEIDYLQELELQEEQIFLRLDELQKKIKIVMDECHCNGEAAAQKQDKSEAIPDENQQNDNGEDF